MRSFSIADLLTSLRLVLVPVFAIAVLLDRPLVALVVFGLAGFTDVIDGSVARWIDRQTTERGAILDPIADKLLLQTCFIALACLGVIPLWFLLMAFVRDAMIVAGIFYLKWARLAFPLRPVWASKLATLFQLGLAVLALLRWGGMATFSGAAQVFTGLITVATFLIIVSAIQYVRLGLDVLAAQRARRSPS